MRALWMPDVLRAAGLTVHGVSGWRNRGQESWGPIRGITIHETRGSRTSSDAGEIRVLTEGSQTAPAPISQLYLSRTGDWHVVASGLCFHNLTGWGGGNKGLGNDALLGIEAQHALGEPWTDRQYRSYVTGVAALVRHLGIPVSRVVGHKEHQPGDKSDPGFDMDKFRRDVAAALEGDDMPSAEEVAKAVLNAAVDRPEWSPVAKTKPTMKVSAALETTLNLIGGEHRTALAEIRANQAEIRANQAAILRAVSGQPGEQILAEVQAQSARLAEVAGLLGELAERTDDPAALTRIAEAIEQIASGPTSGATAPQG